jgi:threonine synthase
LGKLSLLAKQGRADLGNFRGYRCSICGSEYDPLLEIYTCPEDGGNLDVVLDFESIRRQTDFEDITLSDDRSIWRYTPLLPVHDPGFLGTPLRSVGWTPLYTGRRLASNLGLKHLWFKDDGRNPTASLKDRASAVVVARAREINAEVVVTASTGNAGAALAGMAAAACTPAIILAPKTAPRAKVAQLLIFGAKVVLVDGNYDEAFDLTIEAADAFGWYCRNTGYNPFTAEGKKTAAFEICEQFTLSNKHFDPAPRRWICPETVFVSVGDGNIISGLHKGFKDLYELKWIEKIPKIFGVQSEGSSAVYNAFIGGTERINPVSANTIADSISVDLPRDGLRALRAATQTEGAFVAVSDQEILVAMHDLAGEEAIFAEPAGATSYAGLVKAVELGLVQPDQHHLVLITGSGLKDVPAALKAVDEPVVIEPSLKALENAVRRE